MTAPSPYDDPVYRANRRVVLENVTRCAICGEWFGPGARISVDHAVPLAHGGTHDLSNLRAVHALCNSRAGGAVRGQPGGF